MSSSLDSKMLLKDITMAEAEGRDTGIKVQSIIGGEGDSKSYISAPQPLTRPIMDMLS